MNDFPAFEDVLDAAERLNGLAVRTPLLRSDALDAACGGKVFVKAECLQRTGSFKFRGAYNRLSRFTDDERVRGVVAFSSGNHAQGVAHAARLLGMPSVIIMPSDAPAMKIDATRGYGAEVILYDRFTESREEIGARIARERGAILVPPFENFHVIAGQGTVGLEAIAQLEEQGASADVVVCPASGGGLIAGVGLAFRRLSPGAQIIVAEPQGYDDHALSLAAGERVSIKAGQSSLCDALMSPAPGELTFSLNRHQLSGAVDISDDEALAAISFAFRHLKVVIEPGGVVALASLLTGKVALDGRTALAVASGGNIDPALYARAITSF